MYVCEVVLAAVQNYGLALKSALWPCLKNRDFVLAAVQQDGRALEFASLDAPVFINCNLASSLFLAPAL